MVNNHLLTGMILQVLTLKPWSKFFKCFFGEEDIRWLMVGVSQRGPATFQGFFWGDVGF